jgi:predicted ATP-grasp superfamily ATP-dependent carboligase
VQRLRVRPLGAHPFVSRGAGGPLALPASRLAALDDALQALAREFGLRGLASLDFIDDGERAWLLELNPRPSASLALYGPGWMRMHVEAALHGRLPAAADEDAVQAMAPTAAATSPAPAAVAMPGAAAVAAAPSARGAAPLRGTEIVFARAPLVFDAARAQALAARPDCHDLPAAGSRFAQGDPVCSVDAEGRDVNAVTAALAAKRQALRDAWAAA